MPNCGVLDHHAKEFKLPPQPRMGHSCQSIGHVVASCPLKAQQAPGSQEKPVYLQEEEKEVYSFDLLLEAQNWVTVCVCGGILIWSGSFKEQASIGRMEKVETEWVGGTWHCYVSQAEIHSITPSSLWEEEQQGVRQRNSRLYPNAREGFGGNLFLYALSESPAPEPPAFGPG